MKALLEYCYELMEIELRVQHTENLFTLLHMAERIDLLCRGGIMEERNDGHTATQGEDGKFTGSEPYAEDDGGSDSSGQESDSSKSPKSEDKTVGIENVTGKTATIDKRKFTEYALNPEKQPDKAKAFKEALGYDMTNYQELEKQIRDTFDRDKLQENGERAQGKLYKRLLKIEGPNGKTANVMTSWIDDVNDKNDFHLTSIYVKE